jgi:hypothetical protein
MKTLTRQNHKHADLENQQMTGSTSCDFRPTAYLVSNNQCARKCTSTPLARYKEGDVSDSQSKCRCAFMGNEMHYKSVWVKGEQRILCCPQRIQQAAYPFPSTSHAQKCIVIHPAASEQPYSCWSEGSRLCKMAWLSWRTQLKWADDGKHGIV